MGWNGDLLDNSVSRALKLRYLHRDGGLQDERILLETFCRRCQCQSLHCDWNTLTGCCQFCCLSEGRVRSHSDNSIFAAVAWNGLAVGGIAAAALIGLSAGSGITFALLRFHRAASTAIEQPL